MNGLTNYITDHAWDDTITHWYVLVDDAYQRILAQRARPLRASGPAPTFTDSEVITVALIIETFFQGHEEVGYPSCANISAHCFRSCSIWIASMRGGAI